MIVTFSFLILALFFLGIAFIVHTAFASALLVFRLLLALSVVLFLMAVRFFAVAARHGGLWRR